ncbi:MAG: 6,7-dimethyl-8-ribityllumazine synthase [Pedosphaera sp.]|nr:6,7-dimethyl-8-ribityllumazine synthase [Pedosphaera sp.]MST00742.1 6,7-dimethyl-8-ribityllumazine synthase [Pedosphaera sp.]
MLKKVTNRRTKGRGGRFAIVASRYNARYVDSMLRAAKSELTRSGASEIRVVRVPGAYEVPVATAALARQGSWSAIICLGVILRGATTHAQHIGEAVSAELARIAVEIGVPVIHEVLLLENEQQAIERCLGAKFNRGIEAARTALEMARVMRSLSRVASE